MGERELVRQGNSVPPIPLATQKPSFKIFVEQPTLTFVKPRFKEPLKE
jgi:hypothetical protein